MPKKVIDRAGTILKEYEKGSIQEVNNKVQLSMPLEAIVEDKEGILEEKLKDIDPLNMTPMEAINALYELKESIK